MNSIAQIYSFATSLVPMGRSQMPKPPFPPSIWIILVPIFLLVFLSLLMPLLALEKQKPPDKGWRGIFYTNPDDPALFVPKRYGIGYTLNFANPWAWAVVVLIFAMVAVPLILSAAYLTRLPK
jgi:uncharacterized membrane protein